MTSDCSRQFPVVVEYGGSVIGWLHGGSFHPPKVSQVSLRDCRPASRVGTSRGSPPRRRVERASDGIEYPDVDYVVSPVHMDGTLSGLPPRMRHDPDCGHFKWGDGRIFGDPVLATTEQMRTLPACKDRARRSRSRQP